MNNPKFLSFLKLVYTYKKYDKNYEIDKTNKKK